MIQINARRYLPWILATVSFFIFLFCNQYALAENKNGFDLSDTLIPQNEIFYGGPPRDGIPAINNPVYIRADQADDLSPEDKVLGIDIDGEARAYPIRILNWHEIVNDRIGNHSLAITFCPLCGTGIVFSRMTADDTIIRFGVSGLLYNSDMLLYDDITESLWSQILRKAISGPMKGQQLSTVPVRHTTWKDWKTRHPETLVLSTDTGFVRDYDRNPYAGYEDSRQTFFRVSHIAPERYHPKEQVLGIEYQGQFRAYPFYELSKQGQQRFQDNIGDMAIWVHWDPQSEQAWITDHSGTEIPTITGFWFAWYTFHPETQLFRAHSQKAYE